MNAFTASLCEQYDLKVLEVFGAGHICGEVYKVVDAHGKLMVLKTGIDSKTISEIEKNLQGYRAMVEMGIASIVPSIFRSDVSDSTAFLLMEYCGQDLHAQLSGSKNPINAYRHLVATMAHVYRASVRVSSDSQSMIHGVVAKIAEQYEKYLVNTFDPRRTVARGLSELPRLLQSGIYRYSCFSSWDFTPHNICLTEGGLKYIDSNASVYGIPIVDIACLAGLIRDTYQLPESVVGYEILQNFAILEVGQILGLNENESRKIFYLGRTLQLFLSARFRITSDMPAAASFFASGTKYLSDILQN